MGVRSKPVSRVERFLKEDEEIVLYKKGSRGEIVGVYNSINEMCKIEQVYNGNFRLNSIWVCLAGIGKSYTSLHHQCKVVPRIRKTKLAS